MFWGAEGGVYSKINDLWNCQSVNFVYSLIERELYINNGPHYTYLYVYQCLGEGGVYLKIENLLNCQSVKFVH